MMTNFKIDKNIVKIMLVDDESSVMESVSDILKGEGFDTENNLIFIQDSKQENFEKRVFDNIDGVDLILMDLQLEKSSKGDGEESKKGGLEIVEKLRSNGFNIPIIVLTNQSKEESLAESFESHADMFITKEDAKIELAPKISHLLAQYFLRVYTSKIKGYKNLKYFNSKYCSLDTSCYGLFLITIKNKNLYLKYLSIDDYYNKILKRVADHISSLSISNFQIFVYGEDKILLLVTDEICSINTMQTIKDKLSKPIKFDGRNFGFERVKIEMQIDIDIQCNFCNKKENPNMNKKLCFRGVFSNVPNSKICESNNDFNSERSNILDYINAIDPDNDIFEIIPYFQPIRDKNNEIIKYEVLARVKKDNGKVESIYPYLEAVKVTGTSYELTSQIIQKACEIFYRSDAFKDKKVGLSFNITNNELLEYEKFTKDLESWIPWIAKAKDKKAAKSRITFEILERDALSEDILDKIHALDNDGYHIAIDDFGVECSSFDKVSDIARDLIIKIDGKYIKDLRTNKRHQKIVRAIAYAAQELNYLTVAEYVEDETTLQMLIDYGIDLFQGFYNNGEPNPHMQEKKRERFYKTPLKRRRRR